MEAAMETKNRTLLKVTCVLMILLGIPLAIWALFLVNQATASFNYGGLGCFITAILCALLPFAGAAGLILISKDKVRVCRIIGWVFLAVCVPAVVLMREFTVLTLPVYLVLVILYINGSREK